MKKWLRFAKWLWSTPWPVYALTIVQSHLIGAVFVFAFLRFGLPLETFLDIGPLQLLNQYLFIAALVVGLGGGAIVATWLIFPVLRTMRTGEKFDEFTRRRALRMPVYQALLQGAIWILGTTVFVLVNLHTSQRMGLIVGVTALMGGAATCIISYLQAERLLRPVMRRALADGVPDDIHLPGVRRRILLSWVLTSAVPAGGIVLVIIAHHIGLLGRDPNIVIRAVTMLALAVLLAGIFGMQLVTTSVADPVRDLKSTVRRVQHGDLAARTAVYDSTELGALQVGFNEMVAELA
ncbi:HAMP domain-containing protein, partial [Dietzia sp.]|uniref:HAMP domain-containing protein n=1 Tax=Dietzia sp. TaxID=1871616 RepID=UPI002FD9AE0B